LVGHADNAKPHVSTRVKQDLEARLNYALVLCLSEGVSMNESHAVHYYQLSADQGCVEIELVSAECFLSGIGIEVNVEVGLEDLRCAGDHGFLSAQLCCATLFRQVLHIAQWEVRLHLQASLFEVMVSQKMFEKARNTGGQESHLPLRFRHSRNINIQLLVIRERALSRFQ
jgi:hypothetical protein